MASEFDGEALRQPDHPRLARRVGRTAGGRDDRLGRGDVDHPRAVGIEQVGQREAHEPGVSGEVDVERLSPVRLEVVVGLDVRERGVGHRDPRVVDHDVDRPGPRDRAVDQIAELSGLGDVAHDPDRGVSTMRGDDLVDHGGHPGITEVGDDDARSLVGEQVGGRTSHAARRTGDDRDAALDRPRQRGQPRHGRTS